MIKQIKYIFLTIFFLITVVNLNAQQKVTSFATDSIQFIDDMTDYMMYSRSEEGKIFMKDFSYVWFGGYFTDEQREEVYNTTNLMLKNKKRAFPDFRNYLDAVAGLVENGNVNMKAYKDWHQSINKLVDDKGKKAFSDYLQSTRDLIMEGAFYISNTNKWTADNKNIAFEYDSLPKITYQNLTLKCFAKGDSIVIYNTKGSYYPTLQKWRGTGGKVLWTRAGFAADSVFAELSDYSIQVKSPNFEAENVLFFDLHYFKKPLKGRLYEKLLSTKGEDRATYPRFESYNKRLEIKNISKDVDYDGGFALYGRKVIGKGDETKDALLLFKRKGKVFLKVGAKSMVIRPEKVTADPANVTFYIDNDSIYHPGLSFKFFIDKRKVSLIRDYKGIAATPYFDSYHRLDMDFEALYWNLDEPLIELTTLIGGTKSDAHFESENFFKLQRYMAIQGMDDVNPLYQIKKLSEKLDTNRITVRQFMNYTRISEEQAINMLLYLTTGGFINFDYENKIFEVREKLINYVKATAGRVDYDVLAFHSNIKSKSNATLSLLNYDLTIRGVNSILLSDSQQVVIFPANKEVVVKKNRDFTFGGIVQAGRFDFFGKEFSFEYDNFKINLTNVDSLQIYAETGEKDNLGRAKLKPVKTVIEKINGDLLIDNPFNKSGYKQYPEYPIFNSFKESYAFYNKKSVQGGVYSKDDFYFKLEPFTIDSLDNFDNSALKFKGTMVSAGILPDFDETLTLQEDHSLGFKRKAPPEGFDLYGGKATFTNEIRLSNKGLRGDGIIKYVTSTTKSNDFVFHPDSLMGIAQTFEIASQQDDPQFPPASAQNVKVKWLPKKDVMYDSKINDPIAMYDGSKLHGTTILTPDGLKGRGQFEFEKAEVESNLFKFKYEDFAADTADFRLKDDTLAGELSFSTTNVNAFISFKDRFGQFRSNGGGSFIEFPQNQYICFMEEFKWFMDSDDIELSASTQKSEELSDVKLEGSQFISVHPEQDSLSFFSSKARYDLRKKIIYADGVKFFTVADVAIYPDSSKLVVEKKAKMRTLNHAKIIASFITQNHTIYDATVNVFGKKSYTGSGLVDYVDETNAIQTIKFNNISVDETIQTYATTTIEEDKAFTLSPNYQFFGKVNLFANNQYLKFDGYAKISHDCELLSRSWFKFNTEINPNDIYIPIDSNTVDLNNRPLVASVLLSSDSLGIYTAFLNTRQKMSHEAVLPASGYLYYDKATTEYKISNKNKLNEMNFTGNYLSLNTSSCKVYGEGMINLGANTGQVNIQAAGSVIHNQLDDEAIFDLLMMVDFFFADNALNKMAKHLEESSELEPAKIDRKMYEKGLREILGKNEADKLITQASLYGSFKKFPDELNKAMVFNDVKFKWNDQENAYVSFGKIGISNINKNQIHKYVNGKIEILKKRSGDVLNIYLEIDPNNWYFFSYTRGIMQVISSNDEFNTIIQEIKPDKRKAKAEKGQEPYQFMYSTKRKKEDFLKKYDF